LPYRKLIGIQSVHQNFCILSEKYKIKNSYPLRVEENGGHKVSENIHRDARKLYSRFLLTEVNESALFYAKVFSYLEDAVPSKTAGVFKRYKPLDADHSGRARSDTRFMVSNSTGAVDVYPNFFYICVVLCR
jgi:hypothetical protein